MFLPKWLTVGAVTLGLALSVTAAPPKKMDKKPEFAFGALRTVSEATAQAQAEAWLKSTGRADAAVLTRFATIWAAADRQVIDRVADTLALGSPEAAALLSDARNPATPAPKEVPALLKDAKQPLFLRANLAVSLARALSAKRVFEESLEALATVRPEQSVDPSAYLFHKAVAEHALMLRKEASQTILRLLDDCADAPERYRMVAALMFFDMEKWKEGKDLGHVSRLMDNSERRLDLARGGEKTQDIQKKIVFRLDEIIKDLENKSKGGGGGGGGANGGNCPGGQPKDGPPGNTTNPSAPQQDSRGGSTNTAGNVDEKKLKQLAENWGKMPEKERAKAMADLTKNLDPRYKRLVEEYFKAIARSQR